MSFLSENLRGTQGIFSGASWCDSLGCVLVDDRFRVFAPVPQDCIAVLGPTCASLTLTGPALQTRW